MVRVDLDDLEERHLAALRVDARARERVGGKRAQPPRGEPAVELEEVEHQIFARGSARQSIQQLYQLKQRAAQLRHAVAPLLEETARLHGGRAPPVCLPVSDYFRDVHDHLTRILTATEAIRETIGTALQVTLAIVTIEETDTTKKLAAWAAIFAVPTAMAGIWGMNFDSMPELHWRWGYPMALAVIAVSTGILYWRFRRAGWL